MITSIIKGDHKNILGINRRNLDYVYPSANRKFFKIADEKSLAKEYFQKAGVPFPETLREYTQFTDLLNFEESFSTFENVVIKPNKGRGGNGILVLDKKGPNGIYDIDGNLVNYKKIRKHVADIIMGVYSFGTQDKALIERRIFPHEFFKKFYTRGLADIRLLIFKKKPVMAMLRIPTSKSHGKANLHQGGIGIGIDLIEGITTSGILKGRYITSHPDSGITLKGHEIPFLHDMINYCKAVSDIVSLQYIGFDFTLDEKNGPMLLEINARPGLEIQKANQKGLLEVL
ncbi:MAG: hypothetical protein OEV78_03320 [Spirochaetia bacterium]|nr:hypothetical protein [Spirochaetia bacterium]